jgi:8-oxo-dGTP diphosphatase
VEFGEELADAARREAWEEAGCVVGALEMTGVYEMRGPWAQGSYHVIMFAFVAAGPTEIPDGFQGDVGGVMQVPPARVRPYPAVMRILNDAGAASYLPADIEAGLKADQISMTNYPLALPGPAAGHRAARPEAAGATG